ncbi:tyrosine-type recombinase/integrase [Tropicibacter oceani]|uniref:Integrase arm-type DNA-binding domain-containing protein n=1 Tax=Tropicibacter oceani TaxID=3058420 RepID=A0ABY8QHL2_9RHOB|nr:integrase arm-type DNA-binding domain-containing protein [Tropicibacter oceani]WGW03647.1 integrase arm-type DNA-binding domain-containing protein [Tropicibacter oceani]
MPLSDTQIRNLKPKAKPYKVSDFDGLYVTVTPSGSRLWHLKYRIDGREKRLSFGAYPAVSLVQARQLRDEARAKLANNEDPGETKRRQKLLDRERRSHTFEDQAKGYIDKARREGRAPATMAKTEWLLDMACADFGKWPITDITSPAILTCLRKVEAKGNYETAKRLRSKIGGVFRYAIANGLAETDPTQALKDALVRAKPTPRAAITDPKALGGLLRAIDAFEGQTTTRIGLQLLALLAQRPGELRHANWADIDLQGAVWSIPAERMKMRRPHSVPLAAPAMELLNELHEITGNGSYLFPSLRSVKRPMSENTLNAALRRMGYGGDEMTAHGFRACFSTLANESGLWHPDAIERQLAHVEGNAVRRAYARGEHWEERARMMDWWAGYLTELRAS